MERLSFRPNDDDVEATVKTYSNLLFRLCFTMLRSQTDAEDAVAEVFLKYISHGRMFYEEEHKKAWLIRVATNHCKNMLRFYKIRNHASLEEISEYGQTEEDSSILTALFALSEKYRTILYLHYIEGYKTREIAGMLSITQAAVQKRLQYGRDRLKIEYKKGE